MSMAALSQITTDQVAESIGRHLPHYRFKQPTYQTIMLNDLRKVWRGPHKRLLDVGGGTGVVGQCIQDLFPVDSVTAIDVVDRFCPSLTIDVQAYDGGKLPFAHDSFDAATINNVVHHVPLEAREPLFQEIARVVSGPIYIKDHLPESRLDHTRLTVLDAIGNIPFGGMVRADYLPADEWQGLAAAAGYEVAETVVGQYRGVPMNILFPNRLEITMRWEKR
jgi:SAM-dependent methyltransferase